MRFCQRLFLGLFAAGLLASHAAAGTMLAPASATSTFSSDNFFYPIASMFNQSGLFASYTPGVTDFDTFTATVLHYRGDFSANSWITPVFERTGAVDFALPVSATVDSFALWNGFDDAGINQFRLFASPDSTFATATLLGSFTANRTGQITSAQVFDFAPTSAAYIRLQIDTVQGTGSVVTMIGEVAFEQAAATAAVPEPATLTMFGLLAPGLVICLRRRRG